MAMGNVSEVSAVRIHAVLTSHGLHVPVDPWRILCVLLLPLHWPPPPGVLALLLVQDGVGPLAAGDATTHGIRNAAQV